MKKRKNILALMIYWCRGFLDAKAHRRDRRKIICHVT
ncbi:hypothetical protein BMMGA3_16770 (plasmid) [Bacillus methanolicus MGA3]|uniref:Uncharacterized protein n=1 Tax=Bacillus methanolicus (strain MGA3 / ATCC 53907) TaxID=796606 RepID=A0A068LXK9_BACMM|nr:hypothetical protein BMMGA3_16770 [Bacillus methanolicus MGA3]